MMDIYAVALLVLGILLGWATFMLMREAIRFWRR